MCCFLPGVLFDIYDSYSASFYVAGSSVMVSGLVIVSLGIKISEWCHQR